MTQPMLWLDTFRFTQVLRNWDMIKFIEFLLLVDRVVNVLLGGIYKETLSSRAHRMRVKKHPYWGWTADAIDWLFFWELDHCAAQWRREVLMGWHD